MDGCQFSFVRNTYFIVTRKALIKIYNSIKYNTNGVVQWWVVNVVKWHLFELNESTDTNELFTNLYTTSSTSSTDVYAIAVFAN